MWHKIPILITYVYHLIAFFTCVNINPIISKPFSGFQRRSTSNHTDSPSLAITKPQSSCICLLQP